MARDFPNTRHTALRVAAKHRHFISWRLCHSGFLFSHSRCICFSYTAFLNHRLLRSFIRRAYILRQRAMYR